MCADVCDSRGNGRLKVAKEEVRFLRSKLFNTAAWKHISRGHLLL